MRWFVLGTLFFLLGCGGGGPNLVRATPIWVAVKWPAWNRTIQAPKPATSFALTIEASDGSGLSATISKGRPAETGRDMTMSYFSQATVPPGRYYARIRFYADAPIAVAGAEVTVLPTGRLLLATGEPLNNITYYKTIDRVDLQAQNAGPLNEPLEWWVTPTDEFNNMIAIDPAAIDFELTNVIRRGNDLIPIGSPFRMRASIDGTRSSEVRGQAVGIKTVSQQTFGAASASDGSSFWVACRNPNEIRQLSISGSTLRTIGVPSGAGTMTVSQDGTKLFVGHEEPVRISVVGLPGGQVEQVITIQGPEVGLRVFGVIQVPERANAFVVLGEDWGFFPQAFLVVNGSVVDQVEAERGQLLALGGNRYLAWNQQARGREFTVSGDTLVPGRTLEYGPDTFGGERLALLDSGLVSSRGHICHLTSFAVETKFDPFELWHTDDVCQTSSGKTIFGASGGAGSGIVIFEPGTRERGKRLTFTIGGVSAFGSQVFPTSRGIALWNSEHLKLIEIP